MTMQGIAQITARADNMAPERNMKAGDTPFESFMNKQTVQLSSKQGTEVGKTTKKADPATGRKELEANGYSRDNSVSTNTENTNTENSNAENTSGEMVDQKGKNTVTYQSPEDTGLNLEEVAEIVVQTMMILQEMFGLTEWELQDIMNQFSLEPQDLILQVDADQFVPVNTAAIQELILGIHGMDDTAAFLTNDGLNQELNAVVQQITELLSENFSVDDSELDTLDPAILSEFAALLEKTPELNHEAEVPREKIPSGEEGIVLEQKGEESLTVVIETPESTGQNTGENAGDNKKQTLTEEQPSPQSTQEIPTPQASTTEIFKENLVQAFEDVRGTEERAPENVMRQIVDQVVRHVRIRVMPETTSMELQLNPASLGRVSLSVATTAGVATARMVVENQMAKEALESQMIQLKETFAEKGLKVDAVDVTVAEFGLKKENEQQNDPSGGGSRNRRSHSDDNGSEEEENVTETVKDHVTASERRDVNSVVDYTA